MTKWLEECQVIPKNSPEMWRRCSQYPKLQLETSSKGAQRVSHEHSLIEFNKLERIYPYGLWNLWILYFFSALTGHRVSGLSSALWRSRLLWAVAAVFHTQEAAGCLGAGTVGAS